MTPRSKTVVVAVVVGKKLLQDVMLVVSDSEFRRRVGSEYF